VSVIDTEALANKGVVAAYLVSGKDRALIDMGYQSSADTVIRKLREIGVGPDDIHYLLPTHVHLDHAGSCGTLARAFPTATVGVHPVGAPHLADPAQLIASADELFGDDRMRSYGLPVPVSNQRVHALEDDETIDLGADITLRAIWTPGHAPHHLSYLLEESGRVFTGDATGVYYADFPALIPTTPPPSFNLDLAIVSLKRIREVSPSHLLTPHFGIVPRAASWVDQNIKELLAWDSIVRRMLKEDRMREEISNELARRACQKLDRSAGGLPEYARLLIWLSALGFVKYRQKKRNA
jgi:glyoxylase-like metal-dependent hydrolase (beta-lactamase superfamily II)